jgi:LCP family protein required for cell wall assembly
VKERSEQSPTDMGYQSSSSGPTTSESSFDSSVIEEVSATASSDSETKVSSPSSKKEKSPDSPYFQWFFWSAAFLLTATLSAALGASLALLTPLSPIIAPLAQGTGFKGDLWRKGFQYKLSRPVNILVMGIDRVPDIPKNSPEVFSGRSDTMLLVRLDPNDKTVRMLSIPRDTQVEIPGIGMDKINDANVEGGPALAARVVSRSLNDVPIDRYLRITTEAFREMVDLVGGVEVFIPFPMQYTDFTQNLKIDLKEGWQTLNGDQAEQFARFRNDNKGDIGRVQRQQALFKALRQRLSNPTVLPRLPQAIGIMQQYIDTNLSREELLAIVGFGMNLEADAVKMVLLPGRFSNPKEYTASYWIMDSIGRDRVMSQYFAQNPVSSASDYTDAPNRVRVAIQNATDDPGLVERVAEYLAKKDFNNVYIAKDWPERLRETQIIVQQGDFEAANTLKKVLGFGKVEASSTGELDSELTLRIGEDWLNKKF